MSKLKRWQLREVMRKAVQVTTDLSSIGIQTGPEKRVRRKRRAQEVELVQGGVRRQNL